MGGFYPDSLAGGSLNDKIGPLLADIRDFSCKADTVSGSPGTDNTAQFQKALNSVGSFTGGGALWIPPSAKSFGILDVDVPSNVIIKGHGLASSIMRIGTLPTNRAMLNYTAVENVGIKGVLLEGDVTTSAGMLYSTHGGDPMYTGLVQDSTIRVNGDCFDLDFEEFWIMHTGGYAILLDARTGDIKRVTVKRGRFINNRPHLFGTSGGDLNYGSWSGGIHYQMDGITNHTSVKRLSVTHCFFSRCTGNQVWGHAYSVTGGYHERIKIDDNEYIDIGLDPIEHGQENGGSSRGNSGRRIGYICTDDTSPSTPKWLNNFNATALDTSGVVKNMVYSDNDFISVNGGVISADGLCFSTISGNTARIPVSGETEYTDDSIATFGPGNTGQNWTVGIGVDNSANNEGGIGVTITGNHFRNLGGAQMALYASRNCHVAGNTFELPAAPNSPPCSIGNRSSGVNQQSQSNTIGHNTWLWTPASLAPLIFEDPTVPFTAGFKNWISPQTVIGNGNVTELQHEQNTTTCVQVVFPTGHTDIYPVLTAPSQHRMQREGRASDYTSALKFYLQEAGSEWSHMQLQGYWSSGQRGPLLNVSEGGVKGVIATGGITTSVFSDAMLTSKSYAHGFSCLTDTTYADAEANLLNAVVGGGATGVAVVYLQRYKGSVGFAEQSVSILSGARVWTPLGGGSLYWTTSGSDIVNTNTSGRVIVNGTGSGNNYALKIVDTAAAPGINFYTNTTKRGSLSAGASAALGVQDASDTLRLVVLQTGPVLVARTTDDGSGGILQLTGFVSSSVGYYSPSSSSSAINILSGGATMLQYLSIRNDGGANYTMQRTSTTAGTWSLNVSTAGHFAIVDQIAVANRFDISLTGLITIGGATSLTIDQSGNLATTSTDLSVAIQAPSGGISGFNLIASNALFLIKPGSTPALSGLLQAKFYTNGTAVLLSVNGGGYIPLSTGGTVAGSDKWIQFNDGGSAFGATTNFQIDKTLQRLTVTGLTGTAGIFAATSFIQAQEGFFTTSSASTAVNASSGGVTALSLISIRNDGNSGVTIARTAGTARTYGLGVNSTGQLIFNDDSGSAVRMRIDTSGRLAISDFITDTDSASIRQDFFQLKQSDATMSMQATGNGNYSGLLMLDDGGHEAASFQYANSGASFNPGNFFIAARTSGASLVFCSNGLNERLKILNTGEVKVTAGQVTLNPIASVINLTNGAMWYNSGSGLFQFRQNGVTVGLSGTGVSSINSLTGALTFIAGTGTTVSAGGSNIQINIGQAVGTSSNVTFNAVFLGSTASNSLGTSGGISAASAIVCSGSFGTMFQGNGGSFLVDATGNVSGGGVANFVGGYRVSGNVVINSSGILANAFGIDVSAGCAASGYNIHGGGFGQSTTITIASTSSITVSGGIVTAVTAISDRRMKDIVREFRCGIDALRGLTPYLYTWNSDARRTYEGTTGETQIGFIAQDVMAHIPESTYTNDKGHHGYNRDGILASLVVAAKQLDERLKAAGF